jgi:glutathione S-transferase
MSDKPVLHEYSLSGNCYKIRLTAALAGVPIERREYDLMKGETRTPQFLANVSANGRVPVLQVGGRSISESNAICFYLADGTPLIPADRFDRADMLRWMFWEQYQHEPNLATLRFWMRWVGLDRLTDDQRSQIAVKRKLGNEALQFMDNYLEDRQWFVGDAMTLADICLFAYTHVAGEAEFDLNKNPNVTNWIERMKGQPGYLPMIA